MIRISKTDGARIRLWLTGAEAEVRRAVDDFFEVFDTYAYDARMERATYTIEDGEWFLQVVLVRNINFHPRYRRDYELHHHRSAQGPA